MDKGLEALEKLLERIRAMSPEEFMEWYNSAESPEDMPDIIIDDEAP